VNFCLVLLLSLSCPAYPLAIYDQLDKIHPNMTRSMRQTNQSATSRSRTTAKETAASGRVEDYFPAYDDFGWDEIVAYLQTLFPDWDEYNQNLVSISSPKVDLG
jgi:hypothetical protein